LTLHLQSAQQKMDPRSDSGRESVSSQWWEGVDKKSFVNFVLLSLGGRRQRKADNQRLICAFILCMSTSLVQSAGVTGHLHLQTCISEPCHCDTRWCVTPCCLVVVAITTVLAFGENLTL
jgi:hypothetical protein